MSTLLLIGFLPLPPSLILTTEVLEQCNALGIDPNSEGDLVYIAKEALKAPLPPAWKPMYVAPPLSLSLSLTPPPLLPLLHHYSFSSSFAVLTRAFPVDQSQPSTTSTLRRGRALGSIPVMSFIVAFWNRRGRRKLARRRPARRKSRLEEVEEPKRKQLLQQQQEGERGME